MPFNRKITLWTACAFFFSAFLSPALAFECYHVYIENKADAEIIVAWGAQGCVLIFSEEDEICAHATIASGEAKTYPYQWGVTAPTVYVWGSCYAGSQSAMPYRFTDGKMEVKMSILQAGTPGGCGGHYGITISQSDYEEAILGAQPPCGPYPTGGGVIVEPDPGDF